MSEVRRRQFLIAAGALVAVPLQGFAQQPASNMPRIGFLGVSTPAAWAPRVVALRTGLRDLGYVEGKTIAIVFRFAEGQYDRLPVLAVAPDIGPPLIGDRLWLVPGHCDPMVNLYDWIVGVRGTRVECLWPVAARGVLG